VFRNDLFDLEVRRMTITQALADTGIYVPDTEITGEDVADEDLAAVHNVRIPQAAV